MAQSIEDERRALARAKAQSILAEQRAASLEAQASSQRVAAEAARSRVAAVAARVQAAEADIAAAESRIAIIERMRGSQRARLAREQQPAVQLVAALQTLSRRPPALALVQPGTVEDMAHVRAVLSGLSPRIRRQTAALRAEMERTRQLRIDADLALKGLRSAEERLAEQKSELLRLFAARREIADRTASSAMIEQDRAMALGEQARGIADLLGRIAAQGEVRERLAALPGPTLRPANPATAIAAPDAPAPELNTIPYRLPVRGTLVEGLGEVSGFGVRSRGITLQTRSGALVVAPSAGTVAFAGKFRSYGNIVIIDHGRGWTSVLTSLETLDVRAGDAVVQGSPVGKAGQDRPRITVELRRRNQPVDITTLLG